MSADPVIAALRNQQRLYDAFVSAIDSHKEAATRNAYNTAFDELLKTKPRTRAGAAAVIHYCLAEDSRFPTKAEGGDAVRLLRTLAKALPELRD